MPCHAQPGRVSVSAVRPPRVPPVSVMAPSPPRPRRPAPDVAPPVGGPRHWLVKSEPDSFGFDDLWNAPDRTTCWDGVRNYQARNFMRDEMRAGDLVLFYHSSAEPAGVAGTARVVRAGYPDHTAFDQGDSHFDPKSRAEAPTWFMVDVQAVERFPRFVPLAALRAAPEAATMQVLRPGNRLSVTPVTAREFAAVRALAGLA